MSPMLLTLIVVGAPEQDKPQVKSAMLSLKDGRLRVVGAPELLPASAGALTEQEAADLVRTYLEDFLLSHPRAKQT